MPHFVTECRKIQEGLLGGEAQSLGREIGERVGGDGLGNVAYK